MGTDRIGIIGLGYVGLPLAMAFGKQYRVKGFDISNRRISELTNGNDYTNEIEAGELLLQVQQFKTPGSSSGIFFTDDVDQLADCNIYIITVPTPVDASNIPDLTLLQEATRTAAATLQKGDIVIYESTVYPGCTEEIGVPILEEISGLKYNTDFFCGYSPERINPGDKMRTISQIMKITSGSTTATAEKVNALYRSIITAGTYPAPSIKIAEAAKVIENTQRDINIAFVNELSKIFNLLDIDTKEVLKAAGTKWNFLAFQPGLVGGHCIGIDPYYLAHRAITAGYRPELILAARKMNDSMGEYVAERVIQLLAKKKIPIAGAAILVMGITFKENFADVRNSRVVDIIKALREYGLVITLYDPWASSEEVKKVYGFESTDTLPVSKTFAGVIVAVNHSQFASVDYAALLQDPGVLFDVKGSLVTHLADGKL